MSSTPTTAVRARLLVSLELDETELAAIAERSGRAVERVVAEIVGDLECRLHDSCRWRDGVSAVRVEVSW